ncbi:MAG: DUF6122 family protein [Flavobacteriaceae bacterium]|nr:DUF6122 family protein [Flavobacteriaceae bacterium]
MRDLVHYGIHFILPIVFAYYYYRQHFWKSAAILIGAICIDLDHLLANPIFDPNRCSIGFHPLHSDSAIAIYILLCLPKRTRIFGIGLIIHILADAVDCWWLTTLR